MVWYALPGPASGGHPISARGARRPVPAGPGAPGSRGWLWGEHWPCSGVRAGHQPQGSWGFHAGSSGTSWTAVCSTRKEAACKAWHLGHCPDPRAGVWGPILVSLAHSAPPYQLRAELLLHPLFVPGVHGWVPEVPHGLGDEQVEAVFHGEHQEGPAGMAGWAPFKQRWRIQ